MVRYGMLIEHSNGKKEFSQYISKKANIERIEKVKDFYKERGARIYLIKFDVFEGHHTTLEKTEF